MNMFPMESAIDPGGDTDVMLYVVLSLIGLCLENAAYTKCCQMTMKWLRKRTGGEKGTITYPPNRTQGIVGMIWSGIFVLLGLLVIVPIVRFFGLIWTLVAAIAAGLHAYQIFIRKYAGPKIRDRGAKGQLEQLETLKTAGLIDQREYRRKREQIIKEL